MSPKKKLGEEVELDDAENQTPSSYEKGQKVCDVEILDVKSGKSTKHNPSGETIVFQVFKREIEEKWNARMNAIDRIPTGKLVPDGDPRSMTVTDFTTFIERRLIAGQALF